jgi:16S rRNA (guanine966-N2)-methyltransferase
MKNLLLKKSVMEKKPSVQEAVKTRPTTVPARAGAGEVRIIGGQWKRSKLPVADKPGLRPTPDRVRETLFNWLGQDLTGWRCIDVFAGTGALGFEAASRGATEVRLVEQDGALVAQLKRSQIQLQANATQIQRGEGVAVLKQLEPASMDLVFLDPPFDANLFEAALQAAARVVAADGYVYLEAPTAWSDEQLAVFGLVVHRHLKAGAVHAHLLKRTV